MELFAEATDYDPVVVIGEIAHVAGAADAGPRAAPQLATAERNDYENLILLCQNCHARIDGQIGFYSVAKLKDIKQAHEAWVRASLPERGRSRTGWTALALRGDHPLDLGTAAEALSPDFLLGVPQALQVPTDTPDWEAVDAAVAVAARQLLMGDDTFDRRIAIFPLAPVSACISLGYHLTSRPHVRLFQYHRDERTWAWPRQPAPAQDIVVSGLDSTPRRARAATFAFHFSAAITDHMLVEAKAPLDFRVDFRVPRPSTAWLQHPNQLIWGALEARRAFERAMQLAPDAAEWYLFYAGPAPLAVTIGQQINPTMYPPTQLYEYRHKQSPRYNPSIRLGA
jgi:SMODS-associated and fused to various effectors sensor domain